MLPPPGFLFIAPKKKGDAPLVLAERDFDPSIHTKYEPEPEKPKKGEKDK